MVNIEHADIIFLVFVMSFNCLHKNLSIIFHVPLKEGGRHHPLNDLFVVYTTEPFICSCGRTVKPKYTRFMFEVTMLFVVIIRKNKLVYFFMLAFSRS